MPCPSCHSHDLWDDDRFWGCKSCHWFGTASNKFNPRDRFNEEDRTREPADFMIDNTHVVEQAKKECHD